MKISNLKKTLGGFNLNIESLEIEPNRIHGLIGANGCGKSTFIKLLAGILQPDVGVIDYGGLTPREITMLPRRPYLLHDTVYENLIYPLKLRGIPADAETVDYWLEKTALADKHRQYAPNLSGGEQQKLALARALIFSPRLILLDEGLANMDIESIAMFEELIRQWQTENSTTWIIVSHQLSHIERMCEYVYFMDGGKIAAQGETRELLRSPQNAALTRYLQFEALRAGEE